MFKRLPIYKVYKDIENYISWIKIIKREERNPNSEFNKFGLKRNAFFNVYKIITLENDHMQLSDFQKRQKVVENTAPINRYFDKDLRFAEYLVPEHNQVFNKDDNTPTPTYVVVYRFAFKHPIFTFFIKRIIFLILAITIYNNVDWTKFFEWIQNIT